MKVYETLMNNKISDRILFKGQGTTWVSTNIAFGKNRNAVVSFFEHNKITVQD